MAPVGCAVAPPISGQLSIEGIPVLGLVDTGASVTVSWVRYMVALPRPMGGSQAV